jgi:antirestriction protein ArdC
MRKAYGRTTGINTLLLWCEDYEANGSLTYKQALEAGGHVRKGEKGAHIVFWKFLAVTDDQGQAVVDDHGKEKQVPMARSRSGRQSAKRLGSRLRHATRRQYHEQACTGLPCR